MSEFYKLVVFVPSESLVSLKSALFKAGAGRLGNYEHCAWAVLGQGQFRAMAGANPAEGRVGELCALDEYRLEVLVARSDISAVVSTLKAAHPYEHPAFEIMSVLTDWPE
ncbi:MAG: NGG1p interacting factor NIF3 [Pseudomonadales bacterium]